MSNLTNVPKHKGYCVGSNKNKGCVCNSNTIKNSKSEIKVPTEEQWRNYTKNWSKPKKMKRQNLPFLKIH